MTVGDQKEGFIALSLNSGHKPAQLIEGKEIDIFDAFDGAPSSVRDFGSTDSLLRYPCLQIFLGVHTPHRVQLAFASARGRKFLEGWTSITPRVEKFQAIENSAKGNSP